MGHREEIGPEDKLDWSHLPDPGGLSQPIALGQELVSCSELCVRPCTWGWLYYHEVWKPRGGAELRKRGQEKCRQIIP